MNSQQKYVVAWLAVLATAVWCSRSFATEPTTSPSTSQPATEIQFLSPALGTKINGTVILPAKAATTANGSMPLVIYLENLSITRLGQESDDDIIHGLLADGDLVLVLNYGKSPKAVSPLLNADMLELRQEIGGKKNTLLSDYKIDANHVFILVEGYRLKRDVEFAKDKSRVLAMDIQYPSKPIHPVPVLMEITCDNTNRMSCFSLLFCHDTLTDGGMAAGFAVAMIDHPVPPPYKGIDDPEPEVIWRLKAAVRTLRWMAPQLGFSDQIGAMGFSRGGPMSALLAVTGNRPDLEGKGDDVDAHPEISSNVQAALIHGGRYDYSKLDSDDSMLKRFDKVWGPRDKDPQKWDAHGAAMYLTKDAAPMFLNTSDAESKEYRDQILLFSDELTAAGIEHVYQLDNDGRGHHVSSDPKTLAAIYTFFHNHLQK